MSEFVAAISNRYWGDRLEVNTALVLARHRDEDQMRAWVDGLTPPCRAILIEHLGISRQQGMSEVRREILGHHEDLLPFLFIDAVTENTRVYSIVKVARSKLSAQDLARARKAEGGEQFDRNALMWLLYLRDQSNLELVFYLDCM